MRPSRIVLKALFGPGILVGGIALGYLIALVSGFAPSYIPLASAAIGLCVAFAVPVWQAFFLNAPKLSVEITSIQRTVSDQAVITLAESPELDNLRKQRETVSPYGPEAYRYSSRGDIPSPVKIADLADLMSRAKQEYLDLPDRIDERRKELDEVNAQSPSEFTRWHCAKFNGPLYYDIEFDENDKVSTLKEFHTEYKKRLEALEKRYPELQRDLPIAERKLEILRSDLINNRSYFTVSASLINSGRSNTAIKVPALLRVVIGEGNYIDLKLTLKDFENKSEISANGTRIVIFESSEISSLPEEDRRLINTYWGQSVGSRLYLENIFSLVYQSNQIPFAEGLYQKIIYDRLAQHATARSGQSYQRYP